MSDQGKWAKIWISTLSNPDLENLELPQWARWVRLIVFMKAHGTNGKLSFSPPFRALQTVLRVDSFDALCEVIRHCPGFTILQPSHSASLQPSHDNDTRHMLICRNWYKFQGDMSNKRMKKLREKRAVTPGVTSDGESDALRREEKRRITSPSPSSKNGAAPGSALGGPVPAPKSPAQSYQTATAQVGPEDIYANRVPHDPEKYKRGVCDCTSCLAGIGIPRGQEQHAVDEDRVREKIRAKLGLAQAEIT